MKTKIIAIAGRKQSGKSSLCAYIQAVYARDEFNRQYAGQPAGQSEGPLPKLDFRQQADGAIAWYEVPEFIPNCIRRMRPLTQELVDFLHLDDGSVKIYSFADVLKELCVNVLGLKPEQCYGTDEQKNSLTHLKWDNLPYSVRWNNSKDRTIHRKATALVIPEDEMFDMVHSGYSYENARTGFMTGREVMQVFGTDVMRKMFFNDVWVKATLNKIAREKPKVALIADMRFRTEFFALHDAGALVIRLERNITHDTHASETDFDGFPFTFYPRTFVIDASTDLPEKNRLAMMWLESPDRDVEEPIAPGAACPVHGGVDVEVDDVGNGYCLHCDANFKIRKAS